ncbi:GntR family transcriptional regulator [Verticiella sediminum]|uniref:GntR family transcriptional regulator n=1 Tax=Verticiella sediminum TaxID=1247510 RepID=A0A556AKJ5_9BURK|nr:GntR family transcriptional regulator [Verticiella sediminum]TSH93414.1 GntR family transcriptional regulator [Verticiella sediminum]
MTDTHSPSSPAAPAFHPLRRARGHTLSPAEQIARELGRAIVRGDYADGERVVEQAVADVFRVSRGPVRDALRLLEQQSLVEISPRRGTFVRAVSLRDVEDMFAIRGALLGLAARFLAERGEDAPLATVEALRAELPRLLAARPFPHVDFVKAVGRLGTGVVQASGSRQLAVTYRDLPHDAIWQLIWMQPEPPDYGRPERRRQAADDYTALVACMRGGRAGEAAEIARRIAETSCREVISHLGGYAGVAALASARG